MNTYTVYLDTGMRAVIHGETLEQAMKSLRRPMSSIAYSRFGRDESFYWDQTKKQWMNVPLAEAQVD